MAGRGVLSVSSSARRGLAAVVAGAMALGVAAVNCDRDPAAETTAAQAGRSRSTTTAATTPSTTAVAAATAVSTTAGPSGPAPSSSSTARRPATGRPPATTTTARPATAPGGRATLAGCAMFPADNPWNADVSALPVHPRSAAFIDSIGASGFLHADFGSNQEYGIPFVVARGQAPVPITYTDYGDESDPGPFPIPLNAPVEAGSDRHVLALDASNCVLYELFNAARSGDGWAASSGARWPLDTNRLRPEGWTSADAAGLPILPGLVRADEVAAGAIHHALRFTVARTQRAYIHPATHFASSSTDPNRPPMGLRLRLKAGYDISRFRGQARVVLEALRRYGMIVADNGSNWFISGATDPAWDDDDLNQLKTVPGSAFEAVDTGPTRTG